MCNYSCCSNINVILEEQPKQDITVVIDQTGITYSKIENFLLSLSSNFQDKIFNITTNVALNSSNWQETYDEVNLLQSLTSGWQETYNEVNVVQNVLSGNWQNTTNFVNLGILDGGYF